MMSTTQPTADISRRRLALTAALALLTMALLAPFARFGVLQSLVVPGDAATTVANIQASEGLFRAGIAAFLVVIMLDVVVAWALYVLLRPVSQSVALLEAWLRVAFATVFASALVNLLDAAQLVGGGGSSAIQATEVMSSIESFGGGWVAIALGIFGLHLFGLGFLLFRSPDFPRFLGVLVVVAGGGYLVDAFGTILVRDYSLSVSMFTFVGEALLIIWLFARALTGFRPEAETAGEEIPVAPLAQRTPVAS